MDQLTQISLFTGCGGIDLAFERAGFESLLQVEIDRHAISVLERHWPDVERIEDVRDVCKRESENVRPTVIHFGSPCQDISVAGNRKGLDGDRSGLFTEAARIVREFDPDFALWENVDGAFSSNGGRDFQTVLSHLAQTTIPMPRSGKWARAGLVRGNGVEVAWRTFDAQFFAVAQRRTRVFIVVDRRARRAGEILFERTSLSGNTPPSGAPREEVAASLRSRSSNPGVNTPGRGGEDDHNLVIAIKTSNTNQNGTHIGREIAFTLDGTQQAVAAPIAAHHGRNDLDNDTYIPDVVGALSDGAHHGGGLNGQDAYSGRVIAPVTGVRRLTPTECERLQGLSDGWVGLTADGSKISDSQRYKMLGNSVAVPVLEWIAQRMAAVAEQD